MRFRWNAASFMKYWRADAEKHQQIRVIDESGEDYLYPASLFDRITLPAKSFCPSVVKSVFSQCVAKKISQIPAQSWFLNQGWLCRKFC